MDFIEVGEGMTKNDLFFEEMHPQIAEVIGIAVMQLLVENREISKALLRLSYQMVRLTIWVRIYSISCIG